jgi:hypothetical protein
VLSAVRQAEQRIVADGKRNKVWHIMWLIGHVWWRHLGHKVSHGHTHVVP